MEALFRKERSHAFVLKESDVEKIWKLFESNFNEVYAEIEFIDSITRKAVSLPNLLAFENSPKRRIKTIEFCARDPLLEK